MRKASKDHGEEIVRLKTQEGLSVSDISERLGLTKKQVRYRLKAMKIPAGVKGPRRMFSDEQELEICRLYRDKGKEVREIIGMPAFRCAPPTIYKLLRRHKIAIRKPDMVARAKAGGAAAARSRLALEGLMLVEAKVVPRNPFMLQESLPVGTKGSGRAKPAPLKLRFPPLPGEEGYVYAGRR